MKKPIFLLFILFCLLCVIPVVRAADTIFIRETQVPVLIERVDNVLFYLRLDAKESTMLNRVILNFGEDTNLSDIYNPQIQISAESGTKRSIFRQKNKTKRSKKRLHTTLIKPEQKVNEDLCSGFILS